jgi:hypothetical protein
MLLKTSQKSTIIVTVLALTAFCLADTDVGSRTVESDSEFDLSKVVSKILGFLVVGLSPMVRIIQIWKCYGLRSTAGISFVSIVLDYLGCLISFGYSFHYGYPFSTYGENIPLFVGSAVVVVQIWWFDGLWKFPEVTGSDRISNQKFVAYGIGMAGILGAYLLDLFPDVFCNLAMNSGTLLFIVSRSDQIRLILKDKNTGSVA